MGNTTIPGGTSFFDTGSLTERREVDSAGLASKWGLEMLSLSHSVGITGFFLWGEGWALGLQSSCYAYAANNSLTELYPRISCVWMFVCMFIYRCVCPVSKEVRIGFQTPWIWSYRCLWTSMYVKRNSGSLQEQHVFLTTDPTLQHLPLSTLFQSCCLFFLSFSCVLSVLSACMYVCVLCACLVPGFRSLKWNPHDMY